MLTVLRASCCCLPLSVRVRVRVRVRECPRNLHLSDEELYVVEVLSYCLVAAADSEGLLALLSALRALWASVPDDVAVLARDPTT